MYRGSLYGRGRLMISKATDALRARDWPLNQIDPDGLRYVDSNRLFDPPVFAEGLISLVGKLVDAPNEARNLPFAMEVEQFGKNEDFVRFPRLLATWKAGRDLALVVKGFAIAALGVDATLLSPLRFEMPVSSIAGKNSNRLDFEISDAQV